MNTKIIVSLVITSVFSVAHQANAAQGNAHATIKVVSAIAVNNVSNLIFSEAGTGAAAETVNPDQVETAQNASFEVKGEPNRAIAVTLPKDGTVKMMLGQGGDANHEIAVNHFNSNNPTQLDSSGATKLFVGATRDALTPAQASGDYDGNFAVDVVYQ